MFQTSTVALGTKSNCIYILPTRRREKSPLRSNRFRRHCTSLDRKLSSQKRRHHPRARKTRQPKCATRGKTPLLLVVGVFFPLPNYKSPKCPRAAISTQSVLRRGITISIAPSGEYPRNCATTPNNRRHALAATEQHRTTAAWTPQSECRKRWSRHVRKLRRVRHQPCEQ